MMSIGENIKTQRKAANLTQRQIGDKLGITESAVGQFERPDANPQGETLVKLAEAIGCNIQAFFDPTPSDVSEDRPIVFSALERLARDNGMEIIYGFNYQDQPDPPFGENEIFLRYEDGLMIPITPAVLDSFHSGLSFYFLAEAQKLRKDFEEV